MTLAVVETPDRIAEKTASPSLDALIGIARRQAQGEALVDSFLRCDRRDRPFLLEMLAEHAGNGFPIPPLESELTDARFWAEGATRTQLKAYILACFEMLDAGDRAAFLSYANGRAAA